MIKKTPHFALEADLCHHYIEWLKKTAPDWVAYPETGGFDIVLAHQSGAQIGIEAKLKLNTKVIVQATSNGHMHGGYGPNFRAVLVPSETNTELEPLCKMLGITIIKGWKNYPGQTHERVDFSPRPPKYFDAAVWSPEWFDLCPDRLLKLPDYIPDVCAGVASPIALTDWKIRAIKVAIILERENFIRRKDFKLLGISHSRWVSMRWVEPVKGGYTKGNVPDFRMQHPVNFEQIEADFDTWRQALKDKEAAEETKKKTPTA